MNQNALLSWLQFYDRNVGGPQEMGGPWQGMSPRMPRNGEIRPGLLWAQSMAQNQGPEDAPDFFGASSHPAYVEPSTAWRGTKPMAYADTPERGPIVNQLLAMLRR